MDASWESTSPLCQPVRVAANRARVTHLWRLFSMAASLKDDSNAGQGSTCVCSPQETKNRLCALLYIHIYTQLLTLAKGVAASDACVPDTAELSPSEAVLHFPRQSSHDLVPGVQFQPKQMSQVD